MKVLAIDWGAFLGFMQPWEGLFPAARGLLLESKPKAVLARKTFGGELESLVAGGFLRAFSDGVRVRLADEFHEAHKVLRALGRHALLQRFDPRALREYLGEHFTNEERGALIVSERWIPNRDERLLALVASTGHVRGFLAAKNVGAWEKERLPTDSGWAGERAWTETRPLLSDKRAAGDLVHLIETLAADCRPIPFRTLEAGGLSRARLGAAIHAGLRYLLCFPAFDAEFTPVLMLWPSVAERLHRAASPPPACTTPEDSFSAIVALEDLVQFLVRAAEPLRLKQNGWTLFAVAQRELEQGLLPLPAWLTHPKVFPENAPERRVREAQRLAEELGFTEERGESGRDLALVTTPAGWEWLDKTAHERLAVLLELLRYKPERGEPEGRELDDGAEEADELEELEELFGELAGESDDDEGHDENSYDELDEEADELAPFRAGRSRALSDAALFGHSAGGVLTRAAIRAFATLEPGRPVLFGEFLQHHAETANPLLELENPQSLGFGSPWNPPTEEILEAHWIKGLRTVLHGFLLPFGGARVGLAGAGGLTIELTSIGRYLLGLAPEFVLDAPASSKTPVRVQPDFEVVFVSASPALEAALSRFAERRGTGVGVLFRITRDSIMSAAMAGLGAEEVLATLARASSTPVPANVEHEIRAWFGRCRRLSIEPVHLLRCPDAATAARVLSAVGAGKLELVSETVLALRDPKHKAAVMRLCRKAGLFLVNSTEPPAPARGRRRRARWR